MVFVPLSLIALIILTAAGVIHTGLWLEGWFNSKKYNNWFGVIGSSILLVICGLVSWLVFGYKNKTATSSEAVMIETIKTGGITKQIATFSDGQIYDLMAIKHHGVGLPARLVREHYSGYFIYFGVYYRVEFIEPIVEK